MIKVKISKKSNLKWIKYLKNSETGKLVNCIKSINCQTVLLLVWFFMVNLMLDFQQVRDYEFTDLVIEDITKQIQMILMKLSHWGK